jgi:hypothetical protein
MSLPKVSESNDQNTPQGGRKYNIRANKEQGIITVNFFYLLLNYSKHKHFNIVAFLESLVEDSGT